MPDRLHVLPTVRTRCACGDDDLLIVATVDVAIHSTAGKVVRGPLCNGWAGDLPHEFKAHCQDCGRSFWLTDSSDDAMLTKEYGDILEGQW